MLRYTQSNVITNLVQNKLKFSEKLFKKNFKVSTFAFIITRTFKYFAVRFHEVATIFVEGPELLTYVVVTTISQGPLITDGQNSNEMGFPKISLGRMTLAFQK